MYEDRQKVYNLYISEINTFGRFTNTESKSVTYKSLEEGLEDLQMYARIFEESFENTDSTTIRICDDPMFKIIMSRDWNAFTCENTVYEIRLYLKAAYI